MRFIVLLLIGGSVMLGTRAVILTSVMNIYLFYIFKRGGRFSFFQTIILLVVMAALNVVLGQIRAGGTSNDIAQLWNEVFYGNALSDLRDFAWALSAWNGDFLYGKTYLAALMSFVPRAISEFREHWAIGVVTANLIGFSSEVHAGIRMGIFGEAFLNFGTAGVLVIGVINGFLLQYANLQIKRRIESGAGVTSAYCATIPYMLCSQLFISSNFPTIYVFLAIQLTAKLVRVAITKARTNSVSEAIPNKA